MRVLTRPAAASLLVVLAACGSASSEQRERLPVVEGLTVPTSSAATWAITAPSSTSSTSTTSTIPIEPGSGADGLEDAPVPSPPASLALELGPLSNPLPLDALRDPAAVARQWAGLKILTSGLADGPLWPYSVAAHLPALSDPAGQYIANATLQSVTDAGLAVSGGKAVVTVTVVAATSDGATSTLSYDIELWLASAGDRWLVAFADLRT